MGADLMLDFLAMEKNKDPNWDAVQEQIDLFNKDDVMVVSAIYEAINGSTEEYGIIFGLYPEGKAWDGGMPDLDRKAVSECLDKVLEATKDIWKLRYRNSAVFYIPCSHCGTMTRVAIIGGETWGDAPTGMDELGLFYCLGWAKIAGFVEE